MIIECFNVDVCFVVQKRVNYFDIIILCCDMNQCKFMFVKFVDLMFVYQKGKFVFDQIYFIFFYNFKEFQCIK